MPADDIIRLVQSLGARHGFEKSVKIVRGALFDDRCLLSVHHSALGDAPASRLDAIARELGMPPELTETLPAALLAADIVHFGFEGGLKSETYKIYLEYASRTREAMQAAVPFPTLVHLAYKWNPRDRDARSIARYTWLPCSSLGEIGTKIDAVASPSAAPVALRLALGLLDKVGTSTPADRLFLMEVEEDGNPRRSFDLNVYNARLRVGDIAGLLAEAIRDFDALARGGGSIFDQQAGSALGHISAGVGRDGEEFATIYYGVEAR